MHFFVVKFLVWNYARVNFVTFRKSACLLKRLLFTDFTLNKTRHTRNILKLWAYTKSGGVNSFLTYFRHSLINFPAGPLLSPPLLKNLPNKKSNRSSSNSTTLSYTTDTILHGLGLSSGINPRVLRTPLRSGSTLAPPRSIYINQSIIF